MVVQVYSLVLLLLIPRPPEANEVVLPPANELGKIMILMYHQIAPRESTWRRTPENFRQDLAVLYDRGYRPISLRDFVSGRISTPHGRTPIVITFDDGTAGQFRFITEPDGKKVPDPDSAVGILERFHQQHPDFPLEATFFLNGSRPFGEKSQVEEKLHHLLDHGMDIGNHTTSHQNLGTAQYQNPKRIQRAIGLQAKYLQEKLRRFPKYAIDTLALCYGRRPKAPWLNRYLETGSVGAFTYRNIAVLNVGSGPSHSPFDVRFTPLSLSRIRASELNTFGTGLYDWLEHFENNPGERYISDGKVETITVPTMKRRKISKKFRNTPEFNIRMR
jgi:peptidoglycan/xylan/chitin deacetylase (PgdA/CDA1 family)